MNVRGSFGLKESKVVGRKYWLEEERLFVYTGCQNVRWRFGSRPDIQGCLSGGMPGSFHISVFKM